MLANVNRRARPAPLGAGLRLLALSAALLFAAQASAQYGGCNFGGCGFNDVSSVRCMAPLPA